MDDMSLFLAKQAGESYFPYESLDFSPDMICVVHPNDGYVYFNKSWCDYPTPAGGGFASPTWMHCIFDADRRGADAMLEQATQSGVAARMDLRLVDKNGAARWFLFRAHPHLTELGKPAFWLYILTDVHERKLFKLSLAQKTKIQADMLDASPDCIKLIAGDGRLKYMNRAGCRALDVDAASGFGMEWLSLLPEKVQAEGRKALDEASAGRNGRFNGMSQAPGEEVHYWDNMLSPLCDENGDVHGILCVSRDITAKRRNERRIELLLRELNHRSKNLLTIVQALLRRAVPDPKAEYVRALEQRLTSIARSQDMLIHGEWIGTTVRELVSSQTAIAGCAQENRMTLCGDDGLRLRAGAAEMLELALHELTTNAIKYGALSNDEGHISINWGIEQGVEGKYFRFAWEEKGGPEVRVPERRGFGMAVVGRNPLAHHGAKVAHRFERSGVCWDLTVPVAAILAQDEEDQ